MKGSVIRDAVVIESRYNMLLDSFNRAAKSTSVEK